MYKSPIEVMLEEMQLVCEGEIIRTVQNIGVQVDKDELLKALQYDRKQYDRGFSDGVKNFLDMLCTKIGPHLYETASDYLVTVGVIKSVYDSLEVNNDR